MGRPFAFAVLFHYSFLKRREKPRFVSMEEINRENDKAHILRDR
jgi:hypothetical protein